MKIGFIGLGSMGSGMAATLIRAGHQLTVYNRTPARAQALADMGAIIADTPGEASRGDAVFTMVSDDKALEAMVYGDNGILAHLPAGALHITSSTISVELCKKLSADHAKAGHEFVAAPVFGRPNVAAEGNLFVVAGGSDTAIKAATPLLDIIGKQTFVMGDTPDIASLIKLSGNFLIVSVVESLAEAMALVGKAGVDRRQYLDFLTSTLFGAPIYKIYGGFVADQKFEPAGFSAPLAQKDIGLAMDASKDLNVPMPLAGILRDRFLALMAEGGGETLDCSAISRLALRDAGIRED